MENLWPILKKMVRERLPESIPELRNYIYEEWENLNNEYIHTLCDSIHSRIDLCIQSKGNQIKY